MPNDKTSLAALKTLTRPEPDETADEPRVRTTVDLPVSDHHYLKMLATESRMTLSDLVRAAVKIIRESDDVAAQVRQRARRL